MLSELMLNELMRSELMLSELMLNIVKIYAMYFYINNTSNRLDADPGGRAV